MKKNRISVILFLAVLLSVIIYSAYGMVNQGRDDDYISISVIVNDSSNARWDAFREGLEQGAEDNQVHLNLVSTGSFQNAQEEHTIVKRELEGDAAGVIVETYSSEADSVLQGAAADSVVLVKTGVETDTLYTSVMTDHIKFGESLADAAIEAGETKVGILSGNQSQLGMRQRLKGVKERLAEAGVEISWVLSAKELNKKIRNTEYFVNNQVNVGISWRIYGEGRSEKTVYYLDKGLIQELVVPNEYYMGYESMVLAVQMARYHTDKMEQVEVDFFRVTKENLYAEETSRILFPTVR